MTKRVFEPGDVCAGYRIERLLGHGGFAEVYEAVGVAPPRARRALKVLTADAAVAPKIRERLAQEGEVLSMIDHVNVVRFFDAGVHGDSHVWLLLEYVEGQNLRAAIRNERDTPIVEAATRWIRQACEGLSEAHRIGAIHRDLKPENILVSSQGVVKVIDFGLVKLRKWGVKTSAEQQLGTASYMAPEQVKGQEPDARVDVYAMGLMLYEAIAGFHPIVPKAMTMFEVCDRQLSHRPPPLASVVPDVAPELSALVDSAIEKDPARRPQTMRAMADGLQQALERMLAPLRASARNVPLPGRGAEQAVTVPMLIPPMAGASRPPISERGTQLMGDMPIPGPQWAASQGREAVPPPASVPQAAPASRNGWTEVMAAQSVQPVAEAPLDAARRSSAAAVSSATVPPEQAAPRAGRRVWMVVGGALAVATVTGIVTVAVLSSSSGSGDRGAAAAGSAGAVPGGPARAGAPPSATPTSSGSAPPIVPKGGHAPSAAVPAGKPRGEQNRRR